MIGHERRHPCLSLRRILATQGEEREALSETSGDAIRSYRFVITIDVEPGHPAYDDPEWAADAAHGALTNEYGLRTTYSAITESTPDPHDN